jgi:hypothetical protein
MRTKFRLLLLITKASLLIIAVLFALGLVFGAAQSFQWWSVGRSAERAAIVLTLLALIVATARWIFLKLCLEYQRHEARAMAITYGAISPISLGISIPLGQIPGGYLAVLGLPFEPIGAFVGVVATTTALSFGGVALALWVTRQQREWIHGERKM